MTGWIRKLFLTVIVLVNAGAGWLILTNESDYRVDLDSVLEIWADFMRDADKIGLTVTRLSTAKEIEIGDELMAYYPVEQGTPLAKYVDDVGQQVAKNARRKDMPYKFHVINASEINAYAIPGGHVFITKPMLGLMKSEAELASVLGHEISHIDLRHCIERLQFEIRSRQIFGELAVIVRLAHSLVDAAYSKQQESEADRSGMLLMAEAGYSPIESLGIFVRLQSELGGVAPSSEKTTGPEGEVIVAIDKLLKDYSKTHPGWTERVIDQQKLLEQNEATWSKAVFCVGTTNFQDRVPCFVENRTGESETVSPKSAAYQLKLGVLAELSGQRQEASDRFTAALKITPDLADRILQRGHAGLKAGDKLAALADFGTAMKLFLVQISNPPLLPVGATPADQSLHLREAFAEHTMLATELGRNSYATIPAHIVNYPLYDRTVLCRMALDRQKLRWNADARLKEAQAELKARRLGVNDCRFLLNLPKLKELEFEEWSDKGVCQAALNSELALWSFWRDARAEAGRRWLTMDRCRISFGLLPLAEADFGKFSDESVCGNAVDAERNNWGNLARAVKEAKRRGYMVDDCRNALGLPRFSQWTNGDICRGALGTAPRLWSYREFVVAEAKRRKLTIARCRVILDLPSMQVTGYEGVVDKLVCQGALDASKAKWGNWEMAVLEALGRGFFVSRCRELLGLPSLKAGEDDDRFGVHGYIKRADFYRQSGQFEKAVSEYSRATAIDPRQTNAYLGRGHAFRSLRQYREAIVDISTAIELNPKDLPARIARCETYVEMGEPEKAVQDCTRAIELDRGYKFAYFGRGNAYRSQRLFDKAVDDYGMVILLEPSNSEAYAARGFAYLGEENYDRSSADFEKAIELKPNSDWAYAGLGHVNVNRGNLDKALVSFDKAIAINAKYWEAYARRGRVYFALRDWPRAAADLRQAAATSPSNPYSQLWLEIAERRGKTTVHLAKTISRLDMTVWPAPLIRLFVGDSNADAVFAAAKNADAAKARTQLCEANFYIGQFVLLQGNKTEAARLFQLAEAGCPHDFLEWPAAKAELKALGQ